MSRQPTAEERTAALIGTAYRILERHFPAPAKRSADNDNTAEGPAQ